MNMRNYQHYTSKGTACNNKGHRFIYIRIFIYYKLFLYLNLCLNVMFDSALWSFTSMSFIITSCSFTSVMLIVSDVHLHPYPFLLQAVPLQEHRFCWNYNMLWSHTILQNPIRGHVQVNFRIWILLCQLNHKEVFIYENSSVHDL
jgi:hypothetical protein